MKLVFRLDGEKTPVDFRICGWLGLRWPEMGDQVVAAGVPCASSVARNVAVGARLGAPATVHDEQRWQQRAGARGRGLGLARRPPPLPFQIRT